MSQSAYSDLKAAWHLNDIKRLRYGLQIVPHQVHFIISDLCNHDCHFCSYRMAGGFSTEQFAEDGNHNPDRRIDTDKCLEILDDCRKLGVKAIQFTGGGEPTVHKEHLRIFKYAQGLGLQTALVTNGYRLAPGWQEVYAGMSWIRVSIDAGSSEVYGRVRNIKPEAYWKTMQNLRAIREATRFSGTLLGAGYVVTHENFPDLIDGCSNIKSTGVPYVRLAAMFSKEGPAYYKSIYEKIKKLIAEAKAELEDESFKIVDLFGDRIDDLEQGAPDYNFCGYQQFVTYIGANLKVYRCCTTSYTKHGEIGDLSEQGFLDWFESTPKKKAIAGFDDRSCDVCQFNNKNKVINYMLMKGPMHVEFV